MEDKKLFHSSTDIIQLIIVVTYAIVAILTTVLYGSPSETVLGIFGGALGVGYKAANSRNQTNTTNNTNTTNEAGSSQNLIFNSNEPKDNSPVQENRKPETSQQPVNDKVKPEPLKENNDNGKQLKSIFKDRLDR